MADSTQTSAALHLIDAFGPLNDASAMTAIELLRYRLGAAFLLSTI